MSRYYCPFCSSRYQFHEASSDGVLICGLCGDPLVKKPLQISRRIIGIVSALAFLTPLLLMVIFLITNFTKEKNPNNSESLALSKIDNSWKTYI